MVMPSEVEASYPRTNRSLTPTAADQRTPDTAATPPASLPWTHCRRDPTAVRVQSVPARILPQAASWQKQPARLPALRPCAAHPRMRSESPSIATAGHPTPRLGIVRRSRRLSAQSMWTRPLFQPLPCRARHSWPVDRGFLTPDVSLGPDRQL